MNTTKSILAVVQLLITGVLANYDSLRRSNMYSDSNPRSSSLSFGSLPSWGSMWNRLPFGSDSDATRKEAQRALQAAQQKAEEANAQDKAKEAAQMAEDAREKAQSAARQASMMSRSSSYSRSMRSFGSGGSSYSS